MRQLILAMHNYESANRHFPPAFVADESGKPMHSWRVLILPFLDEQAVFDAYNFDEPWDGPNNCKLVGLLNNPNIFRSVEDSSPSRDCTFKLVTGQGTAFQADKTSSFPNIRSGSTNTLAFIEDRKHPVNWMAPDDLSIDQAVDIFDASTRSMEIIEETKFLKITIDRVSVGFLDGHVDDAFPLKTPTDIEDHFTIDAPPAIPFSILDLQRHKFPSKTELKFEGFILLAINTSLALLPWIWLRKNHSKEKHTSTIKNI